MKNKFILLLLFLIPRKGFCFNEESKDKFNQKIDSINYFLSVYDTLSPFSPNPNINELIYSVQEEITTRLLEILNDNRIILYEIDTIFMHNSLQIARSEDRRVYLLSFDQKTGGTYQPSTNIIHYRLKNGSVKAEIFGGVEEGGLGENGDNSERYGTSNFGGIFTLDSIQHFYLTIGGVKGCGTCIGVFAVSIKLDSSEFSARTITSFDGRYHNLEEFDFYPQTKEIKYDFWNGDPGDSLYGSEDLYPGYRKRIKGKLRYIDGNFIPVESCEYWEEIGK